ncbi:MAG: 16S rRNA (cytosine(1402)-N(4))-methyltransferase RsmH [Kiritimatiellaeota bacterium]|nr:16S rRNA (cytosine(1402)-N(4))-methyltransferase RsmH [Kiritimatiellota bacterium]
MKEETVAALGVRAGGLYVDGTLGLGGHGEAILEAAPGARLLGIDRDASALALAGERLARFGDRVALAQANFADMASVAVSMGFGAVDGVVLDLGVSSFQLDEACRGFSFRQDGPLDMRMDASQGATAAEWIASFGNDWKALATVIGQYGEEPQAGRVARAILARQAKAAFGSTLALAETVSEAVGGKHSARHPATRTFQAIRMAVNGELQAVEAGLAAAMAMLVPGGRLAVITFHSVEDRLVKRTLAAHVGKWVSLQQGGERWEGRLPWARWVSRTPTVPGEAEVAANPRSRTAKLRVVERGTDAAVTR